MQKRIFILCVLISANVWSQSKTVEKDSLKLETCHRVFWDNLPKPTNWVNDYEDLFTDVQEKELNDLIHTFEKETTVEIGIATIDTMQVSKDKFDDLSLHIAKVWGIGKATKNNGILIAISRGHRKIRIQNGDGIDLILTNEETKKVIDDFFIPGFKKGDYFSGTKDGLQELIRILKGRP